MPLAPPLPPDDNYFLSNTKLGEIVIKTPEKVIENIDNALNEIPDPPEIKFDDSLLDALSTKADDII